MKNSGRSRRKDCSLEELRIELCFKEEMDENNLFLGASITYFFIVLFACLVEKVETHFGIILILTAVMIVWFFRDKRKDIRRKYEKQIESLLNRRNP